MKLFFRLFWGLSILCAGCTVKSGGDVMTIDLDSLAGSPPLFELEATRYIPLETREDVLIGTIQKMIVRDSLIFISDLESNHIHLFDTLGHHRRSLSKQGRGPGEYIAVDDFALDDEMNLYVLCGNTLRVLKYASPDYVFERSIPLDRPVTEIYWQGDVLWAANRMDQQKVEGLVCLDGEGNVVRTVIPYRGKLDDPTGGFDVKPQSFYPGKQALFNQRLSPDVYRFQETSIQEVFRLKSRYMISEESRSDDDLLSGFQSVYETDRFIAGVLWENGRYENAFFIYDPVAQKASLAEYRLPGSYAIMAAKGGSLYTVASPVVLLKIEKRDSLLQKVIPELSENSNPILLEYTIREK